VHAFNFQICDSHDLYTLYGYTTTILGEAAAESDEAEGEHEDFAVGEIVFEDAGDEEADGEGGDAVEHPFAVTGGVKRGAGDVPGGPEKEANDSEHGGDAAVGGELDIDVVEMAVPPGAGERTGDVFRGVAFEIALDLFGTDAGERVGLDHGEASEEEGFAVTVGVGVAASFKDGQDAVFFGLGHDGNGGDRQYWQGYDEEFAPGPDEVEQAGEGADPDAAGPAEEEGGGDEQECRGDAPANGFVEQNVGGAEEEDGHHGAAEGHPMGHESGDAIGDIGVGEIDAGVLGGGEFPGVLEEAPNGRKGSRGAHGGEDAFGGIRPFVCGGEAGDDEEDEEFLDLREGGHGGGRESSGEEGPRGEEKEERCPGGVFGLAPLADSKDDRGSEADLRNGDGDDAGGESGASRKNGPIVTF